MKQTLRIFAIILLFILAVSAFLGSWGLIVDPSGKAIQIPIEMLNGTLFNDYLIPGIILFFAIGVLSLLTAVLTIKKISIIRGSSFYKDVF